MRNSIRFVNCEQSIINILFLRSYGRLFLDLKELSLKEL